MCTPNLTKKYNKILLLQTASTATTKASFKNLEPYSTYKVSIEGREDIGGQIIRGHLKVETLSDLPQLTPKNNGVAPNSQRQSIHFSWASQTLSGKEFLGL